MFAGDYHRGYIAALGGESKPSEVFCAESPLIKMLEEGTIDF